MPNQPNDDFLPSPEANEFDALIEPDPESYDVFAKAIQRSGLIGLPIDTSEKSLLRAILDGYGHSKEESRNTTDVAVHRFTKGLGKDAGAIETLHSIAQAELIDSVTDSMIVYVLTHGTTALLAAEESENPIVTIEAEELMALIRTSISIAFTGWMGLRAELDPEEVDAMSVARMMRESIEELFKPGGLTAAIRPLREAAQLYDAIWKKDDDEPADLPY